MDDPIERMMMKKRMTMKTCPCCGGDARSDWSPERNCFIQCDRCGEQIEGYIIEPSAIDAWNMHEAKPL